MNIHYNKYLKKLSVETDLIVSKLLKSTIKKIKKKGIKVYIIPIHNNYGYYITDISYDIISEKIGYDFIDEPFMIIPLKINHDNELDVQDGGIYIQHNVQYKKKECLQKILENDFGNKYEWDKTKANDIFIKY
tara:strand:+ start:192 stop:590 length:399 start_codon:yes stop_codon:yes gene_type:complete